MYLNTLKPGVGARRPKVRVGRGIGSGLGKTCGRGIKGSGARKSPNVRPGFEGGQMPMKIRLPKFGFWSKLAYHTTEVSLNDLNKVEGEVIDLAALREADLIGKRVQHVKIVLSKLPNFTRKVTVKGLGVTRGAKAAIEAAGGTVEVAERVTAAAARLEQSKVRRAAKVKSLQDKLAAEGIKKPAKKDKAAKAEKATKAKK
ncbi:MAG: 50S ribosomal protein L15 [Candidatus Anaerobiospirillum merdipullorum]|uniref:Large ribosomal subunit protein uL15 n=1 Tax=Candidatus Anaerobiospirillum merdipullorum TaxID=2838450 RepID=A0A9E2NT25_9GAMM|nr:50S ribosomal protein L15 [Candidatus Anaerobiospirillum merdipullorum]